MTVTSSNERMKKNVSNKPKIKVCKDGPYTISGAIPLLELTVSNDAEDCPCDYHVGKRFPLHEDYSLCRCGQSRDKPFCDKTHEAAHFNGTETARPSSYRTRAEELQGPKLVLTDVRDLCSHVGMCLREGGIRNLILHSDDPEARRIALEEVANCNSGRLMASNKKMQDLLNLNWSPQSQWSKSH